MVNRTERESILLSLNSVSLAVPIIGTAFYFRKIILKFTIFYNKNYEHRFIYYKHETIELKYVKI